MKNLFNKKGVGFYLQLGTILFAIVGLISYLVAGQDSYGLDVGVVVLLALGIVVGLVFCIKDWFTAGPIIVMAFFGGAVGLFLVSRFMYYSYLYFGVDASSTISGAMLATTVSFVLMLVLGIVSAFFAWDKGGKKS